MDNDGKNKTIAVSATVVTLVAYLFGKRRGKRRTVKQLNKLNHN